MSEQAWQIPGDWDGESMRCVRLMWPDSEDWRRLLMSLLYTLTRGREWDKATGSIKGAQEIGWRIWDANIPLRDCETGEAITPPTTIEYRGGSLIVISEDDMGQVVTDWFIDDETGEIVVQFGKCCERRYSLAGMVDAGITPDTPAIGEPGAPDVPEETAFTACAKAHALWNVVLAVNTAIFTEVDEDSEFWTYAANDVAAQFPYINFGFTDLVAGVVSAEVLAGSSLESTVFDESVYPDIICRWAQNFNDGPQGISENEWLSARSHIRKAFLAVIEDEIEGVLVADHWANILDAIGRGDAKKLTAYAADTGQTCCEDDGGGETYIEYEGYYLSSNMASYQITNVDGGWSQIGIKTLVAKPVYGCIFNFVPYTQANTKRMAWNPVYLPGVVDVSMFADSSENIAVQMSIGQGAANFADASIAAMLGVLAGVNLQVWTDIGDLGVPVATAMQTIGAEVDVGTGTPPTLEHFYWIHKVGD